LAHGRQLARCLPQARLTVIEGWGHDLPEALWPRLADAVVSTGPQALSDCASIGSLSFRRLR
ncbi:MAG: hypothetical protein KAY56_13740, partial [Inhella sp.]|nr:hypothetical protein [Inhella sp.]